MTKKVEFTAANYSFLMNQKTGTCYKLWNECPCGCGEVVKGTYAQGHDMKVKSQEIAAANGGK